MRFPAFGVRGFVGLGVMALAIVAGPALAAAGPAPESVVGVYDGGQMEVAASLDMRADGSFRFALSYGAMDEEAAGHWVIQGDRVILTSDPVVAPAYVVVSQKPGDPGVLRLVMDSMGADEQQNFQALITKADGAVEGVQLGVDGLSWSFAKSPPPTSVRLLLGAYGATSAALPLNPAAGYLIHYRFVPNDLGKVAFRGAPAAIVDDGLALDFHGGVIKFRRVRR